MKTIIHPNVDLALLRLIDIEMTEPIGGFAQLTSRDVFADFEALGYGDGSYLLNGIVCESAYGQHLIHSTFEVEWEDQEYFGAVVHDGGPAICDGDSGGPAVKLIEGSFHVVGVLSGSTASPEGNTCAPVGGFQLWLKTAPSLGWIGEYNSD